MKEVTHSEQIAKTGQYKDQGEYTQLQVTKDMELEGTAQLRAHLRRTHSESETDAIMRQKGYNPDLLK